MMPTGDPNNPQYSMLPQLATQMSALHIGNASVSFKIISYVFLNIKLILCINECFLF